MILNHCWYGGYSREQGKVGRTVHKQKKKKQKNINKNSKLQTVITMKEKLRMIL